MGISAISTLSEGKTVFAGWDLQDWFGLGGVLAIIVAGGASTWASWVTANRAGRQKIAEARLRWSDRYKDLSIEMERNLRELEMLRRRREIGSAAKLPNIESVHKIAIEMLYMTNPDSADPAARDEYVMEVDLLARLARLGVFVDMDFVRKHRVVLKHNWIKAKNEF